MGVGMPRAWGCHCSAYPSPAASINSEPSRLPMNPFLHGVPCNQNPVNFSPHARNGTVPARGWWFCQGNAAMPRQGRVVERLFTPAGHSARTGEVMLCCIHLLPSALEVCLNDRAFWRTMPLPIWRYKLGHYQMLRKWLSCRDCGLPGRVQRVEEVACLAEMGRRIEGLLVAQTGGTGK